MVVAAACDRANMRYSISRSANYRSKRIIAGV
jgi:hypothetical protein